VKEAVRNPGLAARLRSAAAVDVLAVGKAAAPMLQAFLVASGIPPRRMMGVGQGHSGALAGHVDWHQAGHPIPTEASMVAACRALELASATGEQDLLVLLLSGGASSLMALPAGPLSLDVKQRTVRTLLEAGADIYELNTVRKHISAIKGGRLAAACRGPVLTLAVSDVVGDDVSVIGSGPAVGDPSTWAMALDVIDRFGGRDAYPADAVAWLQRGLAGELPDTPTSDDPRLSRAAARVIGGRGVALDAARQAAVSRRYHVCVLEQPIVGEARVAAAAHLALVARAVRSFPRPLCVLSAGETTVHVTGHGKGGRNQEFALAMAGGIAALGAHVVAASVGTDGVDGPTDASGALVDGTTIARAKAAGLEPHVYLEDNNAYAFFEVLGDLIKTGPTSTNVGDLQAVMIDE
jgi:hydroxypyruvate reductase